MSLYFVHEKEKAEGRSFEVRKIIDTIGLYLNRPQMTDFI